MGQAGDGYESGLGASAIVGRTRKIQFRLNADFDAFCMRGFWAGARRGALRVGLAHVVTEIQGGMAGRGFLEGQARLGIVRMWVQVAAARAILLQASRYLCAPFWLGAFG
jgi:hypothetical protein